MIQLYVQQISEQYEDDAESLTKNSLEFQFIKDELQRLNEIPSCTLLNLVAQIKKFERTELDFNVQALKPYQQQVHMIVEHENNNRFIIEVYLKFFKKLLSVNSDQLEVLQFTLNAFISVQNTLKNTLQQQKELLKQTQTLLNTIQYQQQSSNDQLYEMKKNILELLQDVTSATIQMDKLSEMVATQQKILTENYEVNKESLNEKLYKAFKRSFFEIDEIQKGFEIIKYLLEFKPQDYEGYLQDVIKNLKSTILKLESQDVNEQTQVRMIQEQLNKQEYFIQFETLNNLFSEDMKQKLENIQKSISVIKSIKQFSTVKSSWLASVKQDIRDLSKFNQEFSPLYVSYIQPFILNTTLLNQITEKINPNIYQSSIKDQILDFKDSILNEYFNHQTHLKTCVISQLFIIRNRCLNMNSKVSVDVALLKIKALETNPKIKDILNSKEYMQDMNRILEQHWSSQQEEIIAEIKSGIKDLNSLLYELQQAENPETKKSIQFRYNKKENEIQDCLQNVSSIGNSLGIQLLFMRDLKQDLQAIDQKLKEVQNTLMVMNKDIQYLRGKTVYELFEIRKNNILQAKKLSDARSIYIKLKCLERKFEKDNQKNEESRSLFNVDESDQNSQLNEFIIKKQSSMLIHGPAGSGKSTASRKIEQYLWEQYDTQKQLKWPLIIPIVIQLPQLQDPEYSAITETLLSDNYMFNQNQIRDLKEEIKSQKIQLFIIMDSYDELRKQFIGTNLLITNKVSLWGSNNYPKIITTTRTEVLNIEHYEDWFQSEYENSISLYKEVRLESFNDNQQTQYIEQYTILSVKNAIYEAYTHFTDNQGTLDNFLTLWKSLPIQYNMNSSENLLTFDQIYLIQNIILKDNNIKLENNDIKRQLQESLKELKSFKFFKNTIEKVNISHLLETPFMMEIVVQVLPSLIRQKSEQKIVQQMFTNQYTSHQQILEPLDKLWRALVQSLFFEKYSIIKNEDEIKQLLQECNITQNIPTYTKLLQFQVTQYDFYEVFFKMYFDKQLMKTKEQGQNLNYQQVLTEIWAFATSLAIDLTKRNKTTVEYKPSGLVERKKVQSWEDYYFNDDCREGQYKKIFRSCIPIKVAANNYAFNHKSLQEFLVAKDLIEHLQQDLSQIENFKDHFICLEDWSGDFLKGTCSFVVQNASNSKKIRDNMKSIIKSTKVNVIQQAKLESQQLIRLASNCMYLIAKIGPLLLGVDLRGIQIKDVNLSGANLSNSYLDGSKMDSVDISSINVLNTSMNSVQFTNTKTNQNPKIKFKGKLILSNQGQLITIESGILKYNGESIPLLQFTFCYELEGTNLCVSDLDTIMILNLETKAKLVHSSSKIKKIKVFKNTFWALSSNYDYIDSFVNELLCVNPFYIINLKTEKKEQSIEDFWILTQNLFMLWGNNEFDGVHELIIIKYHKEKNEIEERVVAQYAPAFVSTRNQLLIYHDKLFKWSIIEDDFQIHEVKDLVTYHVFYESPNLDRFVVLDDLNIGLMSFDGIITKSVPSPIPANIFWQFSHEFKYNFNQDATIFIVYHEKLCKIFGTDPLILYRSLDFLERIERILIQDNKFLILQFDYYYQQRALNNLRQLNNQTQTENIKFIPNSLNYIGQEQGSNNIFYYEYPKSKPKIIYQASVPCKFEVSQSSILWNYQDNINKNTNKNTIWNLETKTFLDVDSTQEPEIILQLFNINCQGQSRQKIHPDELEGLSANTFYKQQREYGSYVYKGLLFTFKQDLLINLNQFFIDCFQDCIGFFKDTMICISEDYYITEKQIISTSFTVLYSFPEKVSFCEWNRDFLIVAYSKEIQILTFETWVVVGTIPNVLDTRYIMIYSSKIYIGTVNKFIVYNIDDKIISVSLELANSVQQINVNFEMQIVLLINKMVSIVNEDKSLTQLEGFRGNVIYSDTQIFVSVDDDCVMYCVPGGQIEKVDFDFSQWQSIQVKRVCMAVNKGEESVIELAVYGVYNNQIVKFPINNSIKFRRAIDAEGWSVNNLIFEICNLNKELLISQYQIAQDLFIFLLRCNKVLIYFYENKYNIINVDFRGVYRMQISDDQTSFLVYDSGYVTYIYSLRDEFVLKDSLIMKDYQRDRFVILNEEALIYIDNNQLFEYTFHNKQSKMIADLSKGFYTVGRTSKGFSIAHKDGSIDMYTKIKYLDEVTNQEMENYVIFKTLNSAAKGILSYETQLTDAVIESQEGVDLIGLFHQRQVMSQ